MIVAGWEGGVKIELEPHEVMELRDFLMQFYEGADCAVDHLARRLDEIITPRPPDDSLPTFPGLSPEGFVLVMEMLMNEAIDVDAVIAHVNREERKDGP